MTCKACGYTDDYKVEREPEHGPGMLPGEKEFMPVGGLGHYLSDQISEEGETNFPLTQDLRYADIAAYACPSCGTLRIKA